MCVVPVWGRWSGLGTGGGEKRIRLTMGKNREAYIGIHLFYREDGDDYLENVEDVDVDASSIDEIGESKYLPRQNRQNGENNFPGKTGKKLYRSGFIVASFLSR